MKNKSNWRSKKIKEKQNSSQSNNLHTINPKDRIITVTHNNLPVARILYDKAKEKYFFILAQNMKFDLQFLKEVLETMEKLEKEVKSF